MAQIPLGNGFYYDTETGQTVVTSGGGYFAGDTATVDTTTTTPTTTTVSQETPAATYAASDGKTFTSFTDMMAWENFLLTQKTSQQQLAQQQSQFQATMAAQQQAQAAAQQQYAQQQAEITSGQRKSAFEILRDRFTQAGIPELASEIEAIYRGTGTDRFGKRFDAIPTTSEGFYLALTQTKTYYERFGQVNEKRIAAGFRALDEGTIVKLEDQYQKVMQAYNLPTGFYDQASDFRTFLENDKSASEVADTIQAYSDFTKSTNPMVRQQLKDLYGITDSDLTAYFADPMRGQPILERIAAKNTNTAAAIQSGLTTAIAALGSGLGAGELSYAQQKQKYGMVAADLASTGKLAQIYGGTYGAEQATAAEFSSDIAAQQRRMQLQTAEERAFSGRAGVATPSLGTSTAGGI